MKDKKIAIIGAGVMGQGVAYQYVKNGFKVVLIDNNQDVLENAKKEIKQIGRFDSMFSKEKRQVDLDQITYTNELKAVANAYFIIENITENIALKESLYDQLNSLVTHDTILAINTSCIPITSLAKKLKQPHNVIGIHFMNPVHLKKTVEVIQGKQTTEETIEATKKMLAEIDMKGILVNDAPGFVSNRILMLTVNEAIQTLEDEVATANSIDRIHKECFGNKMGPLETADLIGLDTIMYSLEVLYELKGDQKYSPAPLLQKMVAEEKLGRKTNIGFYKY